MPRVPDASSVTRLLAIQSSAVADPTKRSASYVPAQPSLLYSLRSTDAGRGMFPGQTTLSNPVACGWVNPRHQGYITGPIPRIRFEVSGIDFSDLTSFGYEFDNGLLPPGSDFDFILFDDPEEPSVNIQDLTSISIRNTDDPQSNLFGKTIISTTPAWPGATFMSSETSPNLSANAGTYPGLSTVIHFRNVPVITNIQIRLYGAGL